jgi:hypothetical protein
METIPSTLAELLATWREWQGAPPTVSPMGRLVALAWISAGVATARYLPGRVSGEALVEMLDELREHPERRYALFSHGRAGVVLVLYTHQSEP